VLVALLRGECDEAPLPAPKEEHVLEEILELEFPIAHLEPFRFAFQGLASRLLERLATRGLACEEMQLELRLEGGQRTQHSLNIAAPSSNPKAFVRAAVHALEQEAPGAAIEHLRVCAEGVSSEHDQLDFFRVAGPAPRQLHSMVAELEGLCGPGRVGHAVLLNDYRPDAYTLRPVHARKPLGKPSGNVKKVERVPGKASKTAANASHILQLQERLPSLALRMLRPPLSARVGLRAGRPYALRSAIANGELLFVSGPWRTTGMWWHVEERFAFDHFDVQVSDGTLLRLRHDTLHGRWEIDALYD